MTTSIGTVEQRWQRIQQHPSFRIAAIYVGVSWVLLQAVGLFGASLHSLRVVAALLGAGLIGVIVLSWRAQRAAVAQNPSGRAGGHRWLELMRGHRWAMVAAALIVLGTVAWWVRPHLHARPVVAGADVIAVLPFNTSGAAAAELSEGMVDLLSTSLDQVGGIRALDPRVVVHRWRERTHGGDVDLNGALAIGRDLDAGSVLIGSAVAAGHAVKLTATLRAVDGTQLAQATSAGSADSIFTLVDDLALKLLRDIWRARGPLPSIRVSEITTSSIPAIRAYLHGMTYYRTSQWDSAAKYLHVAVAEDSTFALALVHLAETYGWMIALGDPNQVRYATAAERFSSRLPEREREFLRIGALHAAGDLAAVDSARSFTARYPDDLNGWYYYADALYHSQALLAPAVSGVTSQFQHLVDMDSSFAPALEHPTETATWLHDRQLFERSFAGFARHASADEIQRHALLGRIAFSGADSLTTAFAASLRRADLNHGSEIGYPVWALTGTVIRSPDANGDAFLSAADSLWTALRLSPPAQDHRAYGLTHVAFLRLAAGRASEAAEVIDSLSAQSPGGWAEYVIANALGAGIASPAVVSRALEQTRTALPSAQSLLSRGVMLIALGNTAGAARLAATALPRDTVARHPELPHMLDEIKGLTLLAHGDTAPGIEVLRKALNAVGYRPLFLRVEQPVLFALAVALSRSSQTRAEGIRRLELLEVVNGAYAAPAQLARAEALEAAGDRVGAATAYANVLRIWKHADPFLQPRVETARRALERLSVERHP